MENEKLLSQELALIDQLLERVEKKEEVDLLIARAKHICPFWLPPGKRDEIEVFSAFEQVKGSAV